jgi:hypothetical protein
VNSFERVGEGFAIIIIMQFSDTTNKQGIIQDCESILFGDNYGHISDNSNLLATFTRNTNRALDRVTSLIIKADGKWEWDDTNQTDYPIATTDVVADQQDYRFNVTHLIVHEITAGKTKLAPIDPKDYSRPLSEVFGKGSPQFYDKISDAFFLYPTPDYTETDGLQIVFQRPATYFLATDTTKAPGFATTHHRLLSLWASYDYAIANLMPIARVLRDEIMVMEQDLKDFYSIRSKDERVALRARPSNFR